MVMSRSVVSLTHLINVDYEIIISIVLWISFSVSTLSVGDKKDIQSVTYSLFEQMEEELTQD